VLGTFVLLGLACAVAWWLLVDLAEFSGAVTGGASMGELELGKRFNADGWYAVLGIVGGFLAGLLLTWWRSRDPLLTVLLLLPAAGLAAATTALVGGVLGPGEPATTGAGPPPGETVPVSLAVTADVVYLMWPMAALAGALMVLWSSTGQPTSETEPPDAADDERRPERASAG
jgi:hypothetical protein